MTTPEDKDERSYQLQLCTAGHHSAGSRPRVNIQSAGWVRIQSAPTPQKHICVELQQLILLLHGAFEDMSHSYHEGIEDIPIRRWRELTRRFPIRLPASMDEFDMQLSHRKTRTIGRLGIELLGLFYNDERLAELKRKLGASRTVVIYVRPEDLSWIYVLDPETQRGIRVACTRRFDAPYPLYLHVFLRRKSREGRKPENNLGDPDYAGTEAAARDFRADSAEQIIVASRQDKGELGLEKATAVLAQPSALTVRESMAAASRSHGEATQKEASSATGLAILEGSTLSEGDK